MLSARLATAITAVALMMTAACSDDSTGGGQTPADGGGGLDAGVIGDTNGGGVDKDTGSGGGNGGGFDAVDGWDSGGPGNGCDNGDFGDPCAQNTDCCSGICVESNEGAICTKECVENCEDGFVCKAILNFYPDLVFACVPNVARLCQPCKQDFQCNDGRCREFDDGSFCVTDCSVEECPTGYGCTDVPVEDGETLKECRPLTGSCLCTDKTAGAVRGCQIGNAIGVCFGLETCDAADGWVGCDAHEPTIETCNGLDDDCDGIPDDGITDGGPCEKENEHGTCTGIVACLGGAGEVCSATDPAAETCNYKDDDCDGLTDEDFKTGDLYTDDAHCGTCEVTCNNAIPHASTTCDGSKDVPVCVVKACETGYFQANEFQCLPAKESLCGPCLTDLTCGGGLCREIAGGMFCTSSCAESECPESAECVESGEAGEKICVPKNGTCDCTEETPGKQRPCTSVSGLGTCQGFETCDPALGWTGCNAPLPSPEVCNGKDDDCDGAIDDGVPASQPCDITNEFGTCTGQEVCFGSAGWLCQATVPGEELCNGKDDDCDGAPDEDFKDAGGNYASFSHCGSCNASCAIGFPNAKAVECATDGPKPQCEVTECEPGFFKLNDFQCIPNTANLCEPCIADDNCVLDGAKCLTLSDGTYCGKQCDGNIDCPLGYTCQDFAGAMQCAPATGSCGCDGSNTDLSKSCEVTHTPADAGKPEYTCFGTQQCTAAGWSACNLPLDVCDAIDNNCNGVIDEGSLNAGTGKYDTDLNCGQCGNNCVALTFANAAGVCNATKTVPDCAMKCSPGYSDVNDNPNDGCECQYAGGVDLPDGIDQNCDGVDGEVDNAIFVAKNGEDTNAGTIQAPMLTLGAAIAKAKTKARRDVYVATGVYVGSIQIVAGVNVYGGYSADFSFRDVVLYETVIFGGAPTAQLPGGVNVLDVNNQGGATTTLDGFTVYGHDNKTASGSTYAVYLRDADAAVRLTNNVIYAGDGGNGTPGDKGTDATSGVAGGSGLGAKDVGTTCTGAGHNGGGAGGVKLCGAANVNGGTGGTSVCPDFDNNTSFPQCPDNSIGQSAQTAELGKAGFGPGAGQGGSAGLDQYTDRGYGPYTSNVCGLNSNANCSVCHLPNGNPDGTPGANGTKGQDGAKGTSGNAGSVQVGLWSVQAGSNGSDGGPGGGGGGGGAGGGVETWECGGTGAKGNDVGGSGGGGGSGACGGTGGKSGGGGGASFAIFLYYTAAPTAPPLVQGNLVRTGSGGDGGNGGPAGLGGIGGNGGLGGANGSLKSDAVCAAAGGAGGRGGDGGHGGGGGGGAGGVSYGVYLTGAGAAAFEIVKSANNFDNSGTGGKGGFGGASLGKPGDVGSNGAAAVANF